MADSLEWEHDYTAKGAGGEIWRARTEDGEPSYILTVRYRWRSTHESQGPIAQIRASAVKREEGIISDWLRERELVNEQVPLNDVDDRVEYIK